MSPATNEFGKYSDVPNYGIGYTYFSRVYVIININMSFITNGARTGTLYKN